VTIAGKLDDAIEEHRVRCQPHLLRLRMLARGEAETVLPRQATVEVIRSTEAILAEAEAASSDARAAEDSQASLGAVTFLRVRLNRLAAAADDAIAAAAAGDRAQMRRHLHRFDSLTSAIWTVQQAVYGPAPAYGLSRERY
jgi:hypothetical protein